MKRLLLLCFLCLTALLPAAEALRPNIIFILADDLGYGDIGCFGQRNIRTPNLDRMAREGTRFTQVYAGATVCAPSRAVLMTGRHTGHVSVRGNAGRQNPQAQALFTNELTVAAVLKPVGYATALIGKWGLGDFGLAERGLPWKHGFDYTFGYLNQHHAHNYYPEHLWRNDQKVKLRNVVTNADVHGAGVAAERVDYSADLIAEEALEFVREHHRRPFFLYFAPTLPHANNEGRQQGMEVPDLGEYVRRDWPGPVKAHAAMVSRLDRDVGRLLDLLRELRLDTNTLVVFSSDNGPHKEGGYDPSVNRSSGPWRGLKRDHYEGGIRVPTLAWWPGRVPAGSVSDAIWYFPDVLPTLAAVAGVPAPSGLDGLNVFPSLLGRAQPELADRFLYWEFHEGGFKQAARRGHWKAVRNHPDDPMELYDLATDPGETNNLASARAEVVARFEQYFSSARTDSADWPIKKAPRRAAGRP